MRFFFEIKLCKHQGFLGFVAIMRRADGDKSSSHGAVELHARGMLATLDLTLGAPVSNASLSPAHDLLNRCATPEAGLRPTPINPEIRALGIQLGKTLSGGDTRTSIEVVA